MAAISAATSSGLPNPFQRMHLWAYLNKVKLDFSRPGKPTDNPFIESFNGKFRAEYLNENCFLSFDDARGKIEQRRDDYNRCRPHSSLGDLTPQEFAESCIASGQPTADLQQYSKVMLMSKFALRMDQELGAGHLF